MSATYSFGLNKHQPSETVNDQATAVRDGIKAFINARVGIVKNGILWLDSVRIAVTIIDKMEELEKYLDTPMGAWIDIAMTTIIEATDGTCIINSRDEAVQILDCIATMYRTMDAMYNLSDELYQDEQEGREDE